MMDADLKAKWVAALRSGDYTQGRGALSEDGCNCCLGVLAEITDTPKHKMEGERETYIFNFDGYESCALVPYGYQGMEENSTHILMNMNDKMTEDGMSHVNPFPVIADYIEKNL